MNDFPCKLQKLRIQKNLNQYQLANILGISKQIISAYETGLRSPSLFNLIKFARYFHVSLDYLVDLETKSNDIIDVSSLSQDQIDIIKILMDEFKNNNSNN